MARLKNRITASGVVTVGAGLSVLMLCYLGPNTMSLGQVTALLISIGVGAVIPGYCLSAYSQPATRVERILLATIYGTVLWALGVFLSSLFKIDVIRYLPSFICGGWSLIALRNNKSSRDAMEHSVGGTATLIGGLAGIAALLPSLTKTLSLQRSQWVGYWSFHIDIPFHTALVSEAAQRIPTVYPYADDTELRYTWLTHASLGFLSRVSRVPAFDFILQFWPILAAVAISFLIAALAWKATSSFLVAVAAPIIAACLRGPRIGASSYLDFHLLAPYSLSRDLGTIWLLSLVMHLMNNQEKCLNGRKAPVIETAIVVLMTFALSGGKGSMVPLVFGSLFGGVMLILMQSKQLFRRATRVLIASFTGLFLAQLLVVKSSGHLKFDLFSFTDAIPGITDRWSITWLVAPVAISLLVPIHMYFERSKSMGIGLWTLALLPLVGVGGLTIFGHPGKSQLIFWMTTVPFFAIGLAIVSGYFYRNSDLIEKAITVVAWFSWTIIGIHPASVMHQFTLTLLVCGGGVIIIYLRRMKNRDFRNLQFWVSLPVVIGVVLISCLHFQVDKGLAYDTGSSAGGQIALHQEQVTALKLLRSKSSPSERFITNKHCIVGSVANKDCYARWFWASAISERRTPIEGYSYTWRNVDGPYWNAPNLANMDKFIAAPTMKVKKVLLEAGIHWVYIDTKEPFSASLGDVSTLVFNGEFAKLYHLG